MIVGHGAERPAGARLLEENREHRNQYRRRARRHEFDPLDVNVEIVEQIAACALGQADIEDLHVRPPDDVAQPFEDVGETERRHEQNDGLLVDQPAQDRKLDGKGEPRS